MGVCGCMWMCVRGFDRACSFISNNVLCSLVALCNIMQGLLVTNDDCGSS